MSIYSYTCTWPPWFKCGWAEQAAAAASSCRTQYAEVAGLVPNNGGGTGKSRANGCFGGSIRQRWALIGRLGG